MKGISRLESGLWKPCVPCGWAALVACFLLGPAPKAAWTQDIPTVTPEEAPRIPEVSARQLGYSIRLWSLEDGLPLDRLHSLAQTSDGYLWIGAGAGKLCRFDGTRFTRVPTQDNPLAYTQIYEQLLADRDGGLWIRGRWLPLGRYFNGQFEEIPGVDVLAGDESAGPMIQSADGSLWIAAANPARFFHWTDGKVEILRSDTSTPPRRAVELAADAKGEIWGVWSDGSLFRLNDEGPVDYVWEEGDPGAAERFGGLMKASSGNLAVFSPSGMFQLLEGRWMRTRQWPLTIPWVEFAQEGDDGTVWLATRSSGQILCLRNGELLSVALPGTKPPVAFNSLLKDDIGDVWIATFQGLLQIRPALFRTWSVAEGLPGPRVVSITAGVDSHIWVKTTAQNVYCRFAPTSGDDRLEIVPIRSSARFVVPEDEDSRWLISRSPGSVSSWRHDTVELLSDNLAGEGEPPVIHSVLRTERGELWLSTVRGLYRWNGQSFAPVAFPDGSLTKYCFYLAEDSKGRIYAGTYDEGVHVFEDGVGLLLKGGDEVLEIGAVDLAPDDSLWVVSGESRLARWHEGKWRLLNSSVTQDIEGIIDLRHDHHGGLWLGTESQGLVWMNRSDLEAVAEGRPQEVEVLRFGPDDGLGSLACTGDSAGIVNGPDGRVWIATADGISVVDPKALLSRKRDSHLPTAVIEEALIDDRLVGAGLNHALKGGSGGLSIPPGSARLEVRFAAIDLESGDRVRFRHRLKKYADEWEVAGIDRSAVYHRVAPGRYVFEVQAANAYGVWNPASASVAVAVLPFWWQRSWVQAGFVLMAFAAVWWAFLARVRSLKRRQAIQESFSRELINSQERERKRIAGELHDSLGQNLTIMKNRLVMQNLDKPKPDPELQELVGLVSETIQETRRISHNLRPYVLDRIGLTRAIDEMARQIENSTGLQIDVKIEDIDKFLSPENQINFYRVVQESLNNVVKHADASRVKLEIRQQNRWIDLRIEDDGRGFDVARERAPATASGGMGLSGIAERVHIMGGTVRWISARREGAIVTATIPHSISHEHPH